MVRIVVVSGINFPETILNITSVRSTASYILKKKYTAVKKYECMSV